jgi:hypothetical protein
MRIVLAWSLWLATLGCCAAGLAVTLAVTRPLTIAVLVEGPPMHWPTRSAMPPSGWS